MNNQGNQGSARPPSLLELDCSQHTNPTHAYQGHQGPQPQRWAGNGAHTAAKFKHSKPGKPSHRGPNNTPPPAAYVSPGEKRQAPDHHPQVQPAAKKQRQEVPTGDPPAPPEMNFANVKTKQPHKKSRKNKNRGKQSNPSPNHTPAPNASPEQASQIDGDPLKAKGNNKSRRCPKAPSGTHTQLINQGLQTVMKHATLEFYKDTSLFYIHYRTATDKGTLPASVKSTQGTMRQSSMQGTVSQPDLWDSWVAHREYTNRIMNVQRALDLRNQLARRCFEFANKLISAGLSHEMLVNTLAVAEWQLIQDKPKLFLPKVILSANQLAVSLHREWDNSRNQRGNQARKTETQRLIARWMNRDLITLSVPHEEINNLGTAGVLQPTCYGTRVPPTGLPEITPAAPADLETFIPRVPPPLKQVTPANFTCPDFEQPPPSGPPQPPTPPPPPSSETGTSNLPSTPPLSSSDEAYEPMMIDGQGPTEFPSPVYEPTPKAPVRTWIVPKSTDDGQLVLLDCPNTPKGYAERPIEFTGKPAGVDRLEDLAVQSEDLLLQPANNEPQVGSSTNLKAFDMLQKTSGITDEYYVNALGWPIPAQKTRTVLAKAQNSPPFIKEKIAYDAMVFVSPEDFFQRVLPVEKREPNKYFQAHENLMNASQAACYLSTEVPYLYDEAVEASLGLAPQHRQFAHPWEPQLIEQWMHCTNLDQDYTPGEGIVLRYDRMLSDDPRDILSINWNGQTILLRNHLFPDQATAWITLKWLYIKGEGCTDPRRYPQLRESIEGAISGEIGKPGDLKRTCKAIYELDARWTRETLNAAEARPQRARWLTFWTHGHRATDQAGISPSSRLAYEIAVARALQDRRVMIATLDPRISAFNTQGQAAENAVGEFGQEHRPPRKDSLTLSNESMISQWTSVRENLLQLAETWRIHWGSFRRPMYFPFLTPDQVRQVDRRGGDVLFLGRFSRGEYRAEPMLPEGLHDAAFTKLFHKGTFPKPGTKRCIEPKYRLAPESKTKKNGGTSDSQETSEGEPQEPSSSGVSTSTHPLDSSMSPQIHSTPTLTSSQESVGKGVDGKGGQTVVSTPALPKEAKPTPGPVKTLAHQFSENTPPTTSTPKPARNTDRLSRSRRKSKAAAAKAEEAEESEPLPPSTPTEAKTPAKKKGNKTPKTPAKPHKASKRKRTLNPTETESASPAEKAHKIQLGTGEIVKIEKSSTDHFDIQLASDSEEDEPFFDLTSPAPVAITEPPMEDTSEETGSNPPTGGRKTDPFAKPT